MSKLKYINIDLSEFILLPKQTSKEYYKLIELKRVMKEFA